jgi:hypothetical protein
MVFIMLLTKIYGILGIKNPEFHAYNTRHRDQLRLPLAKTTKYQNSFRYNGAKTWNMLPLRLRTETSFPKLKK